MKAYFLTQLKRTAKMLPSILVVIFILFIGLAVVFGSMIKLNADSSKHDKFTIGIVGSTEDSYLDLGITALETLDSSRFAIEFVECDEPSAQEQLKDGDISAYVVIPEGFIESVMYGEINKIKFYTTADSVGMVTIFKDEITKMISDILIQSQKGIYGLEHAMIDSGDDSQALDRMNELCVEYFELIFNRTDMYDNQILGISHGLSIQGYFLCGITTIFLFLFGVSGVALFVKKDMSLCKMLKVKGVKPLSQCACEYLAYFLVLMLITTVVLLSISFIAPLKEVVPELEDFDFLFALITIVKLIPMVAMITAFQFVLFELCSDIVSGVLLQFLTAISLTYISGCFYPIQFFPVTVQRFSLFLPSSIARGYMAGCITEEFGFVQLLCIAIYFVLFMALAVLVRKSKTEGKRGA